VNPCTYGHLNCSPVNEGFCSDELWQKRVLELEALGATTSDAQAVADAEMEKLKDSYTPKHLRNTQGLQDMNSNLNQRRI